MKDSQNPMSLERILAPDTSDNLDTSETPAGKPHKVTAQHCSGLHAFGATTSTASRDKRYDNSAQTVDAVNVEKAPPITAGVSSGASNIGRIPFKRDKKFIVVNPGDCYTPSNEYNPICGTCGRDDLIFDDLNRHQKSPYCVNERTFKLAYAKAVLNYRYDQLPAVLSRFDKQHGQTTKYCKSDLDRVLSLLSGAPTYALEMTAAGTSSAPNCFEATTRTAADTATKAMLSQAMRYPEHKPYY
ncbi:hypothetical protein BKA58DRAFT_398986 [Alternaria rosae]|uniref:uncharacterized protein n=1 Tax=Alternaria rosae TaxID=1187941 RepID=UPI001E8DB546|nr:uncharacterized protein BKA58DRAFT_398986 [Alternaria rosae]KAH6879000.1 hypothetical protein BKA58DRAFT_398986 [Alternaria rosae]